MEVFKNKSTAINIIISITLILSIGLTIGYTVGYFYATTKSFPEIKIVDEINPGITTIKLLEVKNGQLIGKISGRNARLAYSSDNIMELGIIPKSGQMTQVTMLIQLTLLILK